MPQIRSATSINAELDPNCESELARTRTPRRGRSRSCNSLLAVAVNPISRSWARNACGDTRSRGRCSFTIAVCDATPQPIDDASNNRDELERPDTLETLYRIA